MIRAAPPTESNVESAMLAEELAHSRVDLRQGHAGAGRRALTPQVSVWPVLERLPQAARVEPGLLNLAGVFLVAIDDMRPPNLLPWPSLP
jgi:hypothetical protein